MSEPWTPGPWHMHDNGNVRDDEDRLVSAGTGNDADARLIALAPEMAELLASFLEGNTILRGIVPEDVATIRDLLARARGENPHA